MSASVIETQNITIPTWMRYHYKLQSESSDASDISSGPESTHSIQNRETDLEKNTTDTSSASEYEVEIEYEINGSDDNEGGNFSSASSNHQGAQDFVIAALAVCDASLEVWLTGSEDSSDPDAEDKANISGYRTCLNCKSQNDSPHKITYCEKCYQICKECKMRKTYKCFPICNSCYKIRKSTYPPRPRKQKPLKIQSKEASNFQIGSFVSVSSHDSGIGSSQEGTLSTLDKLDITSNYNLLLKKNCSTSTNSEKPNNNNRKRHYSEDSTEEEINIESKRPKSSCQLVNENDEFDKVIDELKNSNYKKNLKSLENIQSNVVTLENKIGQGTAQSEILLTNNEVPVSNDCSLSQSKAIQVGQDDCCITCCKNPKNAIFVHGRIAHNGCCYQCAVRIYETRKKCPLCNRRLNNVLRVI